MMNIMVGFVEILKIFATQGAISFKIKSLRGLANDIGMDVRPIPYILDTAVKVLLLYMVYRAPSNYPNFSLVA